MRESKRFNKTIGRLDFILSELMGYAKAAKRNELSEPNKQTLKHHAEDMISAGNAILGKLGATEGTPQPSPKEDEEDNYAVYFTLSIPEDASRAEVDARQRVGRAVEGWEGGNPIELLVLMCEELELTDIRILRLSEDHYEATYEVKDNHFRYLEEVHLEAVEEPEAPEAPCCPPQSEEEATDLQDLTERIKKEWAATVRLFSIVFSHLGRLNVEDQFLNKQFRKEINGLEERTHRNTTKLREVERQIEALDSRSLGMFNRIEALERKLAAYDPTDTVEDEEETPSSLQTAPVCSNKTLEDAIAFMEEARSSHIQWAEFQEGNSDWVLKTSPKDLGDAKHHREWEGKFDIVLAVLRSGFQGKGGSVGYAFKEGMATALASLKESVAVEVTAILCKELPLNTCGFRPHYHVPMEMWDAAVAVAKALQGQGSEIIATANEADTISKEEAEREWMEPNKHHETQEGCIGSNGDTLAMHPLEEGDGKTETLLPDDGATYSVEMD